MHRIDESVVEFRDERGGRCPGRAAQVDDRWLGDGRAVAVAAGFVELLLDVVELSLSVVDLYLQNGNPRYGAGEHTDQSETCKEEP